MAEIDKKYSDFQKNECEPEIDGKDLIDEKICPTCQPNPDWVLPAPHWSDLEESYLNETVCEYHISVYENDVYVQEKFEKYSSSPILNVSKEQILERSIIEVGSERILADADKKITNDVKEKITSVARINDKVNTVYSAELGLAHLVAIPAFDLDRQENDPITAAEEDEKEQVQTAQEIILPTNGFKRKVRQLRLALRTYSYFYSTLQAVDSAFVVRQEDNETLRINYQKTISLIKEFEDELNDILVEFNYPKIGNFIGAVGRSKRVKRIKITLRSDTPYRLKSLFVLSDDGCKTYKKLKVPRYSRLRDADMAVVYNFLANLEKVNNDITAAETKPWLDFTLENFYPSYVVDYGDIINVEEKKAGLQCLLENQLGIGDGRIIDSLAGEIVSAFNNIESEMSEQVCRSLNELSSQGGTALAQQKVNEKPDPREQRKLALISRYEKEFVNKILKILGVAGTDDIKFDQFDNINRFVGKIKLGIPGLQSRPANFYNIAEISPTIKSDADVQKHAIKYATQKANYLTEVDSEGKSKAKSYQKYLTSPHTYEIVDASREVYKQFDNTYIDTVKKHFEKLDSFDGRTIIPIIGVCGMSKIAGKAFECLVGGMTFDDFMETLLIKVFEFMEVNTLDLFFNSLPAGFRDEIENVIKEQLGADINFVDLLKVKMAEDGSQKMKDFSRTPAAAKRIQSILNKSNRLVGNISPTDREYLDSMLTAEGLVNIFQAYDYAGWDWDRQNFSFRSFDIDGVFGKTLPKANLEWDKEPEYQLGSWRKISGVVDDRKYKKRSPNKWILRIIKAHIRDKKYGDGDFLDKVSRISTALYNKTLGFDAAITNIQENLTDYYNDIVGFPRQQQELEERRKKAIEDLNNLGLQFGIVSSTVYDPDVTIEDFERLVMDSKQAIADREIEYAIDKPKLEKKLDDLLKVFPDYVLYRTETDEVFGEVKLPFFMHPQMKKINDQITEGAEDIESLQRDLDALTDTSATALNIIGQIEQIEFEMFEVISSMEAAESPLIISRGGRPDELNQFEQAANSFKETALGVKVDVVFDVIFDFVIDSIMESFGLDDLFERLRSYPIVDFAFDKIKDFFTDSCPTAPIITPPPSDFMKSLSVDICDPTFDLTMPTIIIPNIDYRFQIEYQFNEIFREKIIQLVSNIAIKILKKLMFTLESSLCKLAEGAGGFVADALQDGLPTNDGAIQAVKRKSGKVVKKKYNGFVDALNEAFCNDGMNPETSKSRADELADALFDSVNFNPSGNYESAGAKAANIISSVASKNEFLEAMVAREGQGNSQFYSRVANAIRHLAPEMMALLGSPSQVAYFMSSVGSFLSPDDRERIRNLLDAGVPNLPLSPSLCLTNDQLNRWNDLRKSILEGDDPSGDVDKLNDETEKALEDLADIIGDLDTDGPFLGSMTNEALRDACNPENLFNDVSQSETDRLAEEDQIDDYYKNMRMILKFGFFGRGGLLAEAMRDTQNRREFGRSFQKIFRLNYSNSQEEREARYTSKLRKSGRKSFGNRLMDVGYDEEDGAPGVYPQTVAIKQRDVVLSEDGVSYDLNAKKTTRRSSKNLVYKFEDMFDGGFYYRRSIAASNIRNSNKNFGYNLQLLEVIDSSDEVQELNFNVPNFVDSETEEYMKSIGFDYKANNKKDIRKELFISLMNTKIYGLNYGRLYEKMYESVNKKLNEALLTNYSTATPSLPNGYKFGYASSGLTVASFEYLRPDRSGPYDLPEEDKVLGVYGPPDSGVIALDPAKYGGRYSNPPYYVKPRAHTGWYELSSKAFDSDDGCEPKTPQIFSFKDISDNTKNLSSAIRNDPRLSKPEECVSVKPFSILLDSKSKAKLDGVVRTTIRTYLAEYFVKGYGIFSNVQIRSENFDSAMFEYIMEKMKSEMSELGGLTSSRKIRITQDRYWYTFLEQVVEAYQRTIDINGVEPPKIVMSALNEIQKGLDKFKRVNRNIRRRVAKKLSNGIIFTKPSIGYDPIDEMRKNVDHNLVMAVSYRLSDDDQRENFFDGTTVQNVSAFQMQTSSIKKLQFFQKIYFIKLFEKEAKIVMTEMIKQEMTRLGDIISDGPLDNPYYYDIKKAFFGMRSFFPNSTCRVGLSRYNVEKLTSQPDPGEVSDVASSNTQPPIPATEEIQFRIEKYVRLKDKDAEFPALFSNRNEKYTNVVSLSNLKQLIDTNYEYFSGKNLSDFFGDLSFTYKGSFTKLLEKGFNTPDDIFRLSRLNSDQNINLAQLQNTARQHLLGNFPKDIEVIYDNTFIDGDEELPTPIGTTGELGVKYGLRLCVILPQNSASDFELKLMNSNIETVLKSRQEKCFVFDDGTIMIPIASAEVDAIDKKFDDFNPLFDYDLECLVNKIVKTSEYKSMFDYVFNIGQMSSMLSMYCMETLAASIGRGEGEREEGYDQDADADDWDRTINKFAKNYMRREFKSIYLSRTDSADDDDDDNNFSLPNLFALSNPFEMFSFPAGIPWWTKRRAKLKIFDSNEVECVDPEKDLR